MHDLKRGVIGKRGLASITHFLKNNHTRSIRIPINDIKALLSLLRSFQSRTKLKVEPINDISHVQHTNSNKRYILFIGIKYAAINDISHVQRPINDI